MIQLRLKSLAANSSSVVNMTSPSSIDSSLDPKHASNINCLPWDKIFEEGTSSTLIIRVEIMML